MVFYPNLDVNTRDTFLFGKYDANKYKPGGCRNIDRLTYKDVQYLMELNFIDPDESQNDSPTTKEMYGFLKDHPKFYASGYAISPDRDDYRITIDEIRCDGDIEIEELKDFIEFAVGADEIRVRPNCRAWWD